MLPEIFLALQVHFAFDFNIVTDEPLHPMVQEALQADEPMPPYEDNAHVYLMGVVAAEGDDSFEVGKQRFISMGESLRNRERQAYKGYPKTKWSKVKDEPRLCTYSGDKKKHVECVDNLRMPCSSLADLLIQYQYALDNYKKVFRFTNVRAPSGISVTDFYTLEVFRVLGMLDGLAYEYKLHCNSKSTEVEAISEIAKKDESLRWFAAETDDLLLKTMLLVMRRDFYQQLVYSHRNNTSIHRKLPRDIFNLQTIRESSLRKVMQSEIRHDFRLLDEMRSRADRDAGAENYLMEWFYKENLTFNSTTSTFRNAILDSEVPIKHYLEDRLQEPHAPYYKWWRLGNYYGEILSMVGTPRWINMSVDLNNLDLVIRLSDIAINYSELVENQRLEGLPLTKRNPYDNSLPFFDESGQWLCFKVPEELKSQDECIYLN